MFFFLWSSWEAAFKKTVVIGCGTGLNGGVNGSHVVWLCLEHIYKPAYVSSTSKPFSLVIDSSKSKLKGQSPKKKDEEVFYIFYENNKNPLEPIKTGIDLQKYIEEEIEKTKQKDIIKRPLPQRKSFKKQTAFKDPRYFDVPIKIEENGEGFTPPSAIR